MYNSFSGDACMKRRKPLIMTGVRQCGKTYIQRKFGKQIMNKYIGKLLLKYYNICEICTIKI